MALFFPPKYSEDVVKTVREFAALCVVGFVLGIVLGALDVSESVAIAVIVGLGVLVGLVWSPQKLSSAEDPEAAIPGVWRGMPYDRSSIVLFGLTGS